MKLLKRLTKSLNKYIHKHEKLLTLKVSILALVVSASALVSTWINNSNVSDDNTNSETYTKITQMFDQKFPDIDDLRQKAESSKVAYSDKEILSGHYTGQEIIEKTNNLFKQLNGCNLISLCDVELTRKFLCTSENAFWVMDNLSQRATLLREAWSPIIYSDPQAFFKSPFSEGLDEFKFANNAMKNITDIFDIQHDQSEYLHIGEMCNSYKKNKISKRKILEDKIKFNRDLEVRKLVVSNMDTLEFYEYLFRDKNEKK